MSNHHYHKGLFIALTLYLFALPAANSQTAKQIFSNAGIWQDYGAALSVKTYPEFKGRLVNVNWADIEIAPDRWDWTLFDDDVNSHVVDDLPIILLVYTGMNAPDWIFSNGVPKVIETDPDDGSTDTYSPYYLDEDYNIYFKRMVTKVREHIQGMPSAVRNKIIGIQGCYGSTGDQIDYKGEVDEKYVIPEAQLDSLFKVYSLYYYNEYKDLSPKIPLLSNPVYSDSAELYWLLDNCPGGWLKYGPFAKGSQLNFELDKNRWFYNVLNTPQNGQYVRSRSEVVGPQFYAGWWIKNPYKEMFAIMSANIYWGLDWPNETVEFLKNTNYDSTFSFFNKYAGQKVAATATNALCALKDALDASDSERFPATVYGAAERYNTQRYRNIHSNFIAYGAKLEDIAAVTGSEYASLLATGTNDVGWKLLPGNYERFLHQIDANATSAGYWNIDDAHNDVMYGRFGRGFDVANNKNNLYFDLEDNFLRNAPLNSAYPVTIEITYFDNGTGSWRLFYDAQSNSNKTAVTVNCTNTGTWKKRTVTLTDAYLGNRSVSGSDFYIKNMGSQNVIFSTVELSRKVQDDAGLLTTALPGFDTVCINTETTPRFFVLNAASLNGKQVKVNALNGYLFSTNSKGPFTSTLLFTNYGDAINETIYVKQVTSAAGDFTGTITISGGGYTTTVKAVSVVQNSSPQLNATISMLSCYNQKDGRIDLQSINGNGPFKYKWTNDLQRLWTDSTEDINSLIAANYTVTVTAARGCVTSKTFAITQPEKITVSAVQDSSILCKGGSTTVTVTATGGTLPYLGTGPTSVKSGSRSFSVTDANSCKASTSLTIDPGIVPAPAKPEGIDGPSRVVKLQTNIDYSIVNANDSDMYRWTFPAGVVITSGQFTKSVRVNWGSLTGNINVKAINSCDSSANTTKNVTSTNKLIGDESEEMAMARTLNTGGAEALRLTPNPVGSIATLSLLAQNSCTATVEITDIQGKVLLKQQAMIQAGHNMLQFHVSSFKPGMYFIRVMGGSSTYKTLKMIK